MRLFFDLKLKPVGRVIEVMVGFDGGCFSSRRRQENWVLQADCRDSLLWGQTSQESKWLGLA